MKKDMKNAVKYAFEAPEPVRKKSFIRKFGRQKISNLEFMLIQAGYIRKEVWICSVFVLLLALVGTCGMRKDMLWVISSLLPFEAVLAVTENVRSVTFQVAEMEMASRFSLKSVLLARMGIIGTVHLLLLFALLPLGHVYSTRTFFETGVYMLLPYLASTVSGLWVTRRYQGREAAYVCTGFAILISGINFAVNNILIMFSKKPDFHKCVGVLIILVILTVWEYKRSIQRTEDLVWSL